MSGGRYYISQAREEQHQYIAALLGENERLRAAAAVSESDARRSGDQCEILATELERLRARLSEVGVENRHFVEHYQQIEEQSANLANLYVASYQLHSSVDRATVLNTIQEIVINLIGSEQLAIYEHDQSGEFQLAAVFGLDVDVLSPFITGANAFQAVKEGRVFTESSEPQPLTACVPLKIGDRLLGAILVFRLLDHKPSLEQVDHELFDLLAVHASTALYCASLHAETLVK